MRQRSVPIDDSKALTLTLKREWDIAMSALRLSEDELALCCDKQVLNAGIRARRLMRAAARSIKKCISVSRQHALALRAEQRVARNTNNASKSRCVDRVRHVEAST
jgi:hypothetical protein